MEFNDWLAQTKLNEPELNSFISKLELYFNDSGFNSLEFEKKVQLGLLKIDKEIDELLKAEKNAENK